MPRGGYRPGAGRPPGAISTRSRDIAEKAIGDGLTPLEVMLDNMRFYQAEAERLTEQLHAESARHGEVAVNGSRGKSHAGITEMMELRKRAVDAAARAAPYVHPRMGYAASDEVSDPDFVPLAERIKYYESCDGLNGPSEMVTGQDFHRSTCRPDRAR